MKRRRLSPGDDVIIIYDNEIGYTQEPGQFLGYRRIIFNSIEHEIPVFRYRGKEKTGMECFWLLPEEAHTQKRINTIQRQLPELQVKALELSKELGYKMPSKIQDPEIEKMAQEESARMQAIIKKFGFDPRDETWLEDLAEGDRERKWFRFERENSLVFTENWDDVVVVFNQQFDDNLSIEQAKNMSKKRMRYWLGAHNTRTTGNSNKEDWKKVAHEFEREHRERENRMLTWTLEHKDHFPLVKTKKPVPFWPGPYFHECLERVPNLFTAPECKYVKEGTVLRVISYDPKLKYIRLDFPADVRKLIKRDVADDEKPWIKDRADYDVWIKPEEIETHLELLESLE